MIETKDLQGLIKRGYGKQKFGTYLLAQIVDSPGFKVWLETHIDNITNAAISKPEHAMNVAFTCQGLQRLGVPDAALASFSREWRESMVTTERSMRLGDTQHNHPDNWEWGAPQHPDIHLMLCGFFESSKALRAWCEQIEALDCLTIIKSLPTHSLPNAKEHFGFRDGISQPAIKGLHQASESFNLLATGEFVLGHKNEYDEVAPVPSISTELDEHLQLKSNRKGESLLGYNGSYLVFRQLEQDVKAFWQYVDEQSKDEYNKSHDQSRLLYAAKMVGRWPNGKLVKPGATAQPSSGIAHAPDNKFTFENDEQGAGCPLGSHIRRSNPRATLSGQSKAKDAITTSNRHRILRRGRAYGEPLASPMTPDAFLQAEDSGQERGLYFICLNSDIGRQFEFVQQTWLNNSKFRGLYDEVDPIAGVKAEAYLSSGHHFTIPGKPFRHRLRQVPPFIKVKGGAYFFLPSFRALKFLATLKN